MSFDNIYDEIKQERRRQDEKWGGPSHDDKHPIYDWHRFICEYLYKWVYSYYAGDLLNARFRLIQVAALTVAAIEWLERKMERKGAHYERE